MRPTKNLRVFCKAHGGDAISFITELEYSHVHMLAYGGTAAGDRWRHLILVALNPGEHAMRIRPQAPSRRSLGGS
ncbi:MAG: hypothetical protein Q6353_016400 [Candidatus Sigynarchaeum springense]